MPIRKQPGNTQPPLSTTPFTGGGQPGGVPGISTGPPVGPLPAGPGFDQPTAGLTPGIPPAAFDPRSATPGAAPIGPGAAAPLAAPGAGGGPGQLDPQVLQMILRALAGQG